MIRIFALGVAALAFGSALWHVPAAFERVHGQIGELESRSSLDRELMGARRNDVDTRIFTEARRLIPANATFYVAVGEGTDVSSPTTLAAVPPFAAYWLLPRRRVLDPAAADWVVSYGGDLEGLGLAYRQRVEIAPGIVVAEVERG